MQIFPSTIGGAAPAAVQAQDTGSSSNTGSSSANTATVTANDFLQLLVAEMRNQDPTANTDPTQYINQLVQVNSLEQLVQINGDLGGGSATGSTASGATTSNATSNKAAGTPTPSAFHGNLSAGSTGNGAAIQVASALGTGKGQTNAGAVNGATPSAGNAFDAVAAAMRSRESATPTTTISPAR